MNILVLCEGETDAILISYFLSQKTGWHFIADRPGMNLKVEPKKCESANWYQKGKDYLLICGVGGCENIGSFFDKYIVAIQQMDYKAENSFEKVFFIVDRDNKTEEQIEKGIIEKITRMEIKLSSSNWISNTYKSNYDGIEGAFDSYLLIIPENEEGAIENVVLQSISEDEYDKIIVDESNAFVDNVQSKASKYIGQRRMALKAKLGVVFAIMSPMKVFTFIDELLKQVDWNESEILQKTFEELIKL